MSEPQTLRLPEMLDITAAQPLAGEFLAARGADLTIDASSVQRLGGLCLQVLLSAQATWAAEGHSFEVAAPSPELIEGLALFGASDLVAASIEG